MCTHTYIHIYTYTFVHDVGIYVIMHIDEEEDDELAAPLTTLRTTNLLRGKLTADTVPTADDIESGLGDDARVEEPAFGTFEKQA